MKVAKSEKFRDYERRLNKEWHRQNQIFLIAKRERIESVMLSCLAAMNAITHILGYEPEADDDIS